MSYYSRVERVERPHTRPRALHRDVLLLHIAGAWVAADNNAAGCGWAVRLCVLLILCVLRAVRAVVVICAIDS
jgi:hypothetical protein